MSSFSPDSFEHAIRRAQRRLTLQAFIVALPWWWAAALAAGAVAILVDKFFPFGLTLPVALWSSVALGTLGAALWTWWKRYGALGAAIEIDRRFDLKERVSSAWALSTDERHTPAGAALVADAQRRLAEVEIGERFGLRLSRWSWLPLPPALVGLLVALLFNPVWEPTASAKPELGANIQQVQNSSQELKKKFSSAREHAEQLGLSDAEELFRKLEDETQRGLVAARDVERKDALVKLNDLAKELDARRDELGTAEGVRSQLARLSALSQGPGNRFAQALQRGDLAAALKELEDLKKQLAEGQLSEEDREKLAQQLEQLESAMRDMAAAHEDAMRQLERQIAAKRQSGQTQEAERLAEQLARLQEMQPQMQRSSQLAQQLGECCQAIQNGQLQEAADALEAIAAELANLDAELAESQMLAEALDQIAMAKEAMRCDGCDGEGCAQCQGQLQGAQASNGVGRGRSFGGTPEERSEASEYDSQVRQQEGRGPSTLIGLVDGPNARGNVEAQIREQIQASRSDDEDPLTHQPLPRSYRDHTRSYFDTLREGGDDE